MSNIKKKKKFISRNLHDTERTALDFLKNLFKNKETESATVAALQGDLGSGKTAFVKEAAKLLGITENVSSPTFILERIYKIPTPSQPPPWQGEGRHFARMVHIDAYRLKNAEELFALGWEEILKDSKTLVFLEWPECVPGTLPSDAKYISFRILNEKEREIDFVT